MPTLKFGNAIICDHATMGANNKHTLVNVYSGDILLPLVPANTMIGLYLEHLPDHSGSIEIELEFKLENVVEATLAVKADGVVKGQTGVIMIPSFPLGLGRVGTLRLLARSPGYRPTTILTKKVKVGTIPSPTA